MRFDPAAWTVAELAELAPALLLDVTEAVYQAVIVKVARHHGWHVVHTYRTKVGPGQWRTATTENGVPDLMLMRPPSLVFLEVKAQKGTAAPEQIAWIADAQACTGVEAYIVRPTDWSSVAELLTAGSE